MPVMQSVARDLQRSAPFQMLRAEADEEGDGRTLSGYAALFGEPTEINSWEGNFTETIRKGAFRKTIRENTPVMQFDHGRHPLIGSIPIGSITDLREDDQGLYVEGRITDNWLMQPIRDAIAEQTVNGMSFRFEVVREEWRDANGKLVKPEEVLDLLWMPGDRGPLQRELIELKCRELGPVVFPAYVGTSVSVRARDMAAGLIHSDQMTRQIRASLARDAATAAPQVPDDPQLRREVAAVLLYQQPDHQIPKAAPLHEEHPAVTRTTGAPPQDGHPPTPNTADAPLAPEHPSAPNPHAMRLRSNIREITDLMGARLAEIDKDES
ncbi:MULTISPECIES: HK97 family phage prohead protease [unclassified Streptomyces]|uniref:HK97 family phage prohead protease n=1 Tax=unclassified Streptomyces TaxID=2593676 RepID=UPI001488D591|nr:MULTISPECIES: HK97 family phage prohead protease [unclassified Streptomyces]